MPDIHPATTHRKRNMNSVNPRLLDLKDAAMYLGLSETRIREYVKYGKIRAILLPHPFKKGKDTRKLLIEITELDAFVEAHK
jgi:hypothetical protein